MATDKILYSSLKRNMIERAGGAEKFTVPCTVGSGSETFAIVQGMNLDYDQTKYEHELGLLRLLQGHPNVVRFVAEVDSEGGLTSRNRTRYAWLLEYLPVSLEQFVSQSPAPSYAQRCWVALQIVRGVAFIHSKHVIHLDVKPGNVLLDSLERLNVKIIDFDLSVMDNAGVMCDAFGTESFMAPELFGYRNAESTSRQKPEPKPLTSLVDVWSLGLVLMYVFTGKTPWPDRTIGDFIGVMLIDERQLPKALQEMSGDPLRLVQQCLRYDNRISSAELLAQAERCFGVYDPNKAAEEKESTPVASPVELPIPQSAPVAPVELPVPQSAPVASPVESPLPEAPDSDGTRDLLSKASGDAHVNPSRGGPVTARMGKLQLMSLSATTVGLAIAAARLSSGSPNIGWMVVSGVLLATAIAYRGSGETQ